MAVRVWRLLNIVRTAAEIAIRPRHVGGQMTTLNFDELLSPEDAFDNATRRKLDHIAMIMMWAKQMQTEGRLPPDVAKAMDDYFSGADCGGNPGGGGSVL